MSDEVTVWGVANGDTYNYLHGRQLLLANQGADIMAARISTQNPQKVALLDQAMSANQAAKDALAEASGQYNVIAEQIRTYSYGQFNPPSMSVGGVSGMRGFNGLKGFGLSSLGLIPVIIGEIALYAVVAAAVYAMTSLIANMDKNLNAASNLLAQAVRVPEALAQGAKGGVEAASGAVDVLGKAGLYAGIGFAVYLGYQALKKRGKI